MEPSINTQKIQAMKNYKRAKLAYNLALYSLTSIITCFFFSSPFWFPSINSHFFISSFPTIISICFNAKCFFVLGNLIVIILVGESKLKQSSPSSTSSDFYDEYVARSRSSHHKEMVDGSVKTLNVEEKIHLHQEKKKLVIKTNSMPRGEEKIKKGMRSCKSEVWGESGMVNMEKTKSKKEEQFFEGEKIKMGMRSSKSAVWNESEKAKMEKGKGKGKKEEQCIKASMNGEEKKVGMRSSKSAVWSESERVKMERGKGKKEEQSSKNIITDQEEKKVGMRSSRSAVWGESEIVEREEKGKGIKKEEHMQEEKMKMGMRSCRSEIWSESEIVRLGKTHVPKEAEERQLNVLNKRVEDFIARVNKQRLLEAKIVDHSRG